MHKLIQIITCNKSPKDRDYNEIERSIPVRFVEDETPEDNTPNPIKNIEIYGYSQMGYGSGKSECQDTYTILNKLTPNIHFMAVYDGHGIKGREVSLYVNERITKCLERNAASIDKLGKRNQLDSFLKETFKIIDRKLNDSLINTSASGTCCNAVLIFKGKCYVANLGDSRAVLCRTGPGGETITVELSQDHKPTREDEKERIIKMGGRIEPMYIDGMAFGPLRVWNKAKTTGMAMTRTMGDLRGKQAGIIAEPEVHKFDLHAQDKFIIVASDGLWDVMTSEEAVEFVLKFLEEGKLKGNAARALAREARKRWENLEDNDEGPYCDDTTIVIAFPEFNMYM